ncbi:periplasmic heavy metal sensor [Phenylobacterium deserti]|uniref:Periplasmic heavy metal sensor n=1 Tax=Phenylobacterium deserti TaxID=1914756 RepID=A0A328ASP6_9CAUL|nr:periplasmic heavy metal sensor [Phenylobacterium deserti]RAK56706.1 hypothetical protein DJ018_01640 [Phenylobacterium deserti]
MSRKALLIALFVSLTVNVFVVGALAGAALTNLRPPPPERSRGGGPMGPAVAALSPGAQEEWRSALRDGQPGVAARFREARMIRRAAWARLGADQVDTQAVLKELERARAIDGETRAELDRRIVSFAAGLTPEDRKRFAQALAQPRGGPRERRGPSGGGAALGGGHPGLLDR